MRRLLLVVGLVGLSLLPGAAARSSDVTATLEPARTTVPVGEHFPVQAVIRNEGATPTNPLLAHLDVVSLQREVYVDPEDWSDSRTREVASLAPGQSVTVQWSVRAVNAGRFDVHVVVLPVLGTGAGPLAVSSPTYATVTARRTLDPGGSLVVVLGVPAAVGVGALASRLRLRRRARP